MQIFNMAGGGGSGEALLVNAPAGASVTATDGSRTLTKIADSAGRVIFNKLAFGTWTISITDGDNTDSKEIEIMPYYKAGLSFFKATIHITYPAGIVCTVTDGTTTLIAPDTTGTWDCIVPNAGTWTAKLKTGLEETVTLTISGEEATINKWYVFKNGDQCTNITGGWAIAKKKSPNAAFDDNKFIARMSATDQPAALITTNNALNLTGFKTLCASANMTTSHNSTVSQLILGVSTSKRGNASATSQLQTAAKGTGMKNMVYDISGLGDAMASLYPFFNVYCCHGELYTMWLEG